MLPALQARAVIHGRDFVAPEDIEVLAPHVFKHRLECAPGLEDVSALIGESVAAQVERLARSSLQRA
jgi:MoxR-like ATPase